MRLKYRPLLLIFAEENYYTATGYLYPRDSLATALGCGSASAVYLLEAAATTFDI